LFGASLTEKRSAPKNDVNKIDFVKRMFYVDGFVNGYRCIFKVDTGADVTLIRSDFLKNSKKIPFEKSITLKYPTGEKVLVKNKVEISVKLGDFSEKLFAYKVDMEEECLLVTDFLSKVKFDTVFNSFFKSSSSREKETVICSRVIEIPSFLKELFEKETYDLEDEQKKCFAQFLVEFQDVFSEDIVAGNCNEVEHKIEFMDCKPIKQVPRRVPFHFREEVNKIIEDMKYEGVIEESQSPWVSPAVMVKKKDGSIRFCVDYRKLNAVTVKDSFPLPRINDMFDKLSGSN
jgi:dsDNA-binding SOS-regulon protein